LASWLAQACASDPPAVDGPGGPDGPALVTDDAQVSVSPEAGGLDAAVTPPATRTDAATAVATDAAVVAQGDAGTLTPKPDAQVGPVTPDAGPSTGTDSGQPVTPSTANSTLVPHASWTCAMPAGVPPPELGTLAFTAEFAVGTTRDLGKTQFGQRKVLEFESGKISGPKLEASLMKGGYELFLSLSNGAVELEHVLMLEAKGGAPIYLRVCGLAANASDPVRVVMDFEAPTASHGQLNTTPLVGVRELSADGKKLTLRVYDVTSVTASANKVSIEQPAGLPEQTWECKVDKGTNGAEVYRETVAIGGSVRVGASKRGTRNVIPITGGTTTGRLKGKILPLGADFQLLGGDLIIDARYIALTDDNEVVIVRNCGGLGALVPVFEARSEGPYNWINENNWLSSNPSVGLGSVSLTIYGKR
jgi:hypothetical protein